MRKTPERWGRKNLWGLGFATVEKIGREGAKGKPGQVFEEREENGLY